MSTKKLVWLKLREDFFRSVSVKKLRRMAGGDTYTLLYLRMLLHSLPEDGHIYYQGIGDDFADEIALALDESEDDVKVCIAFLFSAKLIEQISDSDIFFVDAARMTGSECQSASRVRAMRERRKQEALQCNAELLQCNAEVTSSDENVTTEYREKSKEKRVKKKEKRDISAQSDLEIAHEPEETETYIFEILLNDGSLYGISEADVETWSKLYPNVDVPQAIRNMIGWSNSNPSRRKTKRGIQRFINGWLERDQNSGKNRPVKHESSRYSTEYDPDALAKSIAMSL